jgi:N-acetylglucosamine kinase-like BadF-type ATPase
MAHQYFLGIDVGATKTAALLADETGTAIGYGLAGPGNHESVGWEGFKSAIRNATDRALAQAGLSTQDITAAGMGLAGLDWDSEYETHKQALAEIGLTMPMFLDNDSALGLYAGASEGWGACVAAGSSNNARGRGKDGTLGRITGHGSEFGEYGGAWEIVHKAVKVVNYEWIKRIPHTALSEVFIEETGAKDLGDLIEGLALRRYHPHGHWAVRVFETAAAGDKAALDVIQWAGRELGELACAIIRQIKAENEPVEVILTGSVYKGGELIIAPLREVVLTAAPKAKLIIVDAPPVVGGVLMGMELALGKSAYLHRQRLLETSKHLAELPQEQIS